MTIDSWIKSAIADAEQRGLPELKAMLEALARATKTLRESSVDSHQSPVNGRQS